jgi:hypothetical protein
MRLDAANEFIGSIASHGRRFFEYVHDDGRQVAQFRRGDWGHIFFWNEWKRQWIYVSRYGAWKGFHHGGTLHALVGNLVRFIRSGEQLNAGFFGSHWGYGDDMETVVETGKRLGVIGA